MINFTISYNSINDVDKPILLITNNNSPITNLSDDSINQVIDYFKLGHRFSRTGIKEKLKEMYQESGYDKTAKASDIKEYLWTKDVKFLEDGKWVNGYEITGKK